MIDVAAHNPDTNPNWTPKPGRRMYACQTCDARQVINTNHTGTVYNTRCVGRCRDIRSPNTAREVVLPFYGPHYYCGEVMQ